MHHFGCVFGRASQNSFWNRLPCPSKWESEKVIRSYFITWTSVHSSSMTNHDHWQGVGNYFTKSATGSRARSRHSTKVQRTRLFATALPRCKRNCRGIGQKGTVCVWSIDQAPQSWLLWGERSWGDRRLKFIFPSKQSVKLLEIVEVLRWNEWGMNVAVDKKSTSWKVMTLMPQRSIQCWSGTEATDTNFSIFQSRKDSPVYIEIVSTFNRIVCAVRTSFPTD